MDIVGTPIHVPCAGTDAPTRIKSDVVACVLHYGTRRFSNGAISYYMDKRARYRAEKALGEKYRAISDYLNVYAIVDDRSENVVTVAHSTQRIRR